MGPSHPPGWSQPLETCAGDHFHNRGFTCFEEISESNRFTFTNLEVDVANSQLVAVVFGQSFNFNQRRTP
jgi:hypothetical protein